MTITRELAAEQRAASMPAPASRPMRRRFAFDDDTVSRGRALVTHERGTVATERTERAGLEVVSFKRYASITERGYEMWDEFGPYVETVSARAFDATLAADPLVEFSVNHGRSIPMAHTRNQTLDLFLDDTGLGYTPFVDVRRTDVRDMVLALERGDLVESSFKFRITRGEWSADFSEYRIEQVDLHRGDVSIVNTGANPFTADYAPRADAAPAAQRNAETLAARLALAIAR